ncbi:MAG TPA: FkbM family methyltransferase [Verrucomicrobiae bacterium]|jgi:FkbM family methyltransferase
MNSAVSISLKQKAQGFFKTLGLYERVKASRIYDFYWSYADPHWITDRAKEVQFYRTVLAGLRRGDLIFDIGANAGLKTDVFLRLEARVVAVEPDEMNREVLKRKFLKNRIFPKAVTIEGKAVSDQTGRVSMLIDAPGSALNTLSPKWATALRSDPARFGQQFDFTTEKTVETTTLESLIEKHGIPFYAKVDVEGHELNVLRGLKRPLPYLSFEVNLPEFREEGLECIGLLKRLAPEGKFNCVADCGAGLKFPAWLAAEEFAQAYRQCPESTIEIFWHNTGPFRQNSGQEQLV